MSTSLKSQLSWDFEVHIITKVTRDLYILGFGYPIVSLYSRIGPKSKFAVDYCVDTVISTYFKDHIIKL